MTTLASYFRSYIAEHGDGTEVSLQFRAPIPPVSGTVRVIDSAGIYELTMRAGDGQRSFRLPIVFAGDDVLWYGRAPTANNQPSIVSPGGFAVGGSRPPTA